jgi:hypothetical protein
MAERKGNYRHGMYGTPTYKSWSEMKLRCNNPNHSKTNCYEGITYCKEWEDFKNFFRDMGVRPEGTTLDRINPYGNYEPSNCRWADNHTQAINKTNSIYLTFNGETKHISEWSKITGIKRITISARILNYGWSVEKALSTKVGDRIG